MALKVGELEADMSLDDSKFDRGMDSSKQKFGRFAKGLAKEADKSGQDAGSGLGSSLGKGLSKALPVLAAAGAIGAVGAKIGGLLKDGIIRAMDVEAANDKLAAQLALTGPESARIGKVAGKLYSANYGESLDDVNAALKGVMNNVDGMRTASNDAVQDATKKVINLGTAFDQDVGETSRAVGKLIKTGLAKDATQALDQLTTAFQHGGDEAGDLLDTVNEYSTQFREAGLSGEQFMGLLSQGLAAGARDADTVADAIKEFEIRARDGSKTTATGFKDIGLNAKHMADEIAAGGPRSAAALDTTLDRLRNMKDPVERDAAAVALFGTKAEDLGDALFALDPSTAVASLGKVKGAASDMDSVLSGNAKSSLESFKRSVVTAFTDEIGPSVEKFGAWLAGPGKYQVAEAFIFMGLAVTGLLKTFGPAMKLMVDMSLGSMQLILQGMIATFGWMPNIGDKLRSAEKDLGTFRDATYKGFDLLTQKSGEWNKSLQDMQTEVKLKADISNWETQLKAAKKQLEDKSLTKERKAQIKADIADLEKKLRDAKGGLANPQLVATKVAKLQADKRDLDKKIADAQYALKAPSLTATKRAKLEATIAQLLAAKKQAQSAINSLTGKTVNLTVNTYKNLIETKIPGGSGVRLRALGGPVVKGEPYIVGEERPELFVPDEDGRIIPNVPGRARGSSLGATAAAAGGMFVLKLQSSGSAIDNFLMEMLRRAIRTQGGNVQVVLGS